MTQLLGVLAYGVLWLLLVSAGPWWIAHIVKWVWLGTW